MLDDALIVLPPGSGRLAPSLVEAASRISRRLTAITFRDRAKRIPGALSDVEKDEFATRQGVHDEQAEALAHHFSEAARGADRGFHILEDEPDDIADRVCIQSRRFPLTVMSLGDDLPAEFHLLSMVLYVAWRPVLVVPTTSRIAARGPLGRAIVAWNGTPQSARALTCANRAVEAGVRVDVISVGPESDLSPAPDNDAVAVLSERGVVVSQLHLTAPKGATVAQQIGGYLRSIQAELLLIGAPSRRSQMDFNIDSTGSQLLRTSTVPVLVHP